MDDLSVLEKALNSKNAYERKDAVEQILEKVKAGELQRIALEEVNNHVHTFYSFSPYSPSGAVFKAWKAGLGVVGLIDHDSISGAEEMLCVSEKFSLASTVGFELRVSFKNTPFRDVRINNPDSYGIAYMCVHGVPHTRIKDTIDFLTPIQKAREGRSLMITEKINRLSIGVELDYKKDVESLSLRKEGGTVTERHILYALAEKIILKYGKGENVIDYLKRRLTIALDKKNVERLRDVDNPYYEYDLLGILKAMLLPAVYIQPGEEECPDVREVLDFASSIGAISAYAYLGDITQNVTGDKKNQKYEDEYLDKFIPYLKQIGFKAVTYMPPRNTDIQMRRVIELAKENNLMEISGVDINSPRQSFNSPEVMRPVCRHLVDSAWALVAHEKLSSRNSDYGLFSPNNPMNSIPQEKRIKIYAAIGKGLNQGDVYRSADRNIDNIGGFYGR